MVDSNLDTGGTVCGPVGNYICLFMHMNCDKKGAPYT